MNPELESMPISLNEKYTFDHDPRQGVTLGFWNNRASEFINYRSNIGRYSI